MLKFFLECFIPFGFQTLHMGFLRVVLSLILALVVQTSSINITVSVTAPTAATQVAPSLIGLSIEQDRWTDWAGFDNENQFFFNVLENLKDLSGEPPYIRIGGNSQDNTNFNPSVIVRPRMHRMNQSLILRE